MWFHPVLCCRSAHISQSREVLLLNAHRIKLGQTRWKRTKGLGKQRGKKTRNRTKTPPPFIFSLKPPWCSSLWRCVSVLCVSAQHRGRFSGSPSVNAALTLVLFASPSSVMMLLGGLGWLCWAGMAFLVGIPDRQRSRRGSQTDPHQQPGASSATWIIFLLSTFSPLSTLSCFWRLPLLSLLQQRLFYKGGAFPIQGLKSCVIQYFLGRWWGEIITQQHSQLLWFFLIA